MMYDAELEEIRRRKMLELQKRLEEEERRRAAEIQVKAALRAILDKDAYERLGRVRMADPELYAAAVQTILYMYRAGQIRGKLSDEELKSLLERIRDRIRPRKQTRIRILEK